MFMNGMRDVKRGRRRATISFYNGGLDIICLRVAAKCGEKMWEPTGLYKSI